MADPPEPSERTEPSDVTNATFGDSGDIRVQRYRQLVPRPHGAAPGGVAPWAGLPSSDRRSIDLKRVASALAYRLVPPEVDPEDRPHAAVLVPMFERDGETRIVLIRRSWILASNPGDLAFPGGRLERGERALDAAIREAEEEVDLDPRTVTVVGRLGGVSRARGRGEVVPYVGLLAAEPRLRADPYEVDAVFTVALADLAGDGAYWEEEWDIPGQGPRLLYFFANPSALGDNVIWGMTAMIVRELLSEVLLVAGP